MVLADRVNRIQSSSVLVSDAKAKALKAYGGDVIGFGAGEYVRLSNLVGMTNIKKSADRIEVACKTRKSRNLVRRCKAPHFF